MTAELSKGGWSAPWSAIAILVLFLLPWLSCSEKKAPTTDSETATSGTLEVVADEELRPAIDSMIVGFMQENPNAKLTARYVTSGEAIQELLAQRARLIIISRGLTEEARSLLAQNKLELPELELAEDALGVIVRADNPVEAIAMSDIKRIVRGEATHWSDLRHSISRQGTPLGSETIVRFLAPISSSSEWLLDSLSLEKGALQQGSIKRFASTDSLLRSSRMEAGSISFIGSSWAQRLLLSGDSSLKVIPVIPADSSVRGVTKPIMLHMFYVYQGLYPLTLRVNGYTFEVPNTLPRGFLVYASTFHGQTVFKNHEVLPRTQHLKFSPPK